MNLDKVQDLLLHYTRWLNVRGNLAYPATANRALLVELFLKEEPEEIRPEAPVVLHCHHIDLHHAPVHYQFKLEHQALNVCCACYDSIQGNILEDLTREAVKEMFGRLVWKDHKPFIG